MKVCHYLPDDTGGKDILKKVTNGDIGGEGSLKFGIFVVISFLSGPLSTENSNCVSV